MKHPPTAWLCLLLLAAGSDLRAAPPAEPHWAFQPPTRPQVPTATNPTWVRNPIDAFVAAEHEHHHLTPRPEAPRQVLLRRLYLDLVGLPPTRDELHAFLADPSPDAYDKVVDRLLSSPQYGQRWGRHWMDVWRYSDWAGYQAEVRESQPFVWRWRDWIVESLNADKPYDQMVREMLAGDEIAPQDPQVLRATGFLARNWYKFNRNVWLENTVEHTSKAFLALTVNCARCHDHKYDPVSQVEHYRFRAFFEPYEVRTDRVPGEPDTKKDGVVRAFDADATKKTFLFLRGDEKSPVETEPLSPGVPAALCGGNGDVAVAPVALPTPAYYQGREPWLREETLRAAATAVSGAEKAIAEADGKVAEAQKHLEGGASPDTFNAARATLEKAQAAAVLARLRLAAAKAERAAVEAKLKADDARYATPPAADAAQLAAAAGAAERQAAVWTLEAAVLAAEQSAPNDEQKKQLAESKKKLEEARAKAKEPANDYTALTPVNPPASTGRRLALANWITDAKNPLAARVAVNHVWARHFGEGLVPTVFDFGKNGKPPTNQPLLDWLAVDLRDNGWSMKRLHRLIVTSSTYRMDSAEGAGADAEKNRAADADNRYLWHAPVRRMEAELVRDAVLHVAGKLDLTMGGPELDPAAGLTSGRRSLYFRHAHEKQMTFLQLFDAASPNECYRRQHSVVPQQALALANSPLALAQARVLAGRLKDEGDFITAAFESTLSRSPTDAERATCEAFLKDQSTRLADATKLTAFPKGETPSVPASKDPVQRAKENLVHVLLNHNDFVTIR